MGRGIENEREGRGGGREEREKEIKRRVEK